MLIHDLTERYGPVVREGRVTGVLDAAFDIFIVSSWSFDVWTELTISLSSGLKNGFMLTKCH